MLLSEDAIEEDLGRGQPMDFDLNGMAKLALRFARITMLPNLDAEASGATKESEAADQWVLGSG